MLSPDRVEDHEELFRRVEFSSLCYQYNPETGELEVTQTAFNDRNFCPSVDRAKLCNNDPWHTIGRDDRNGVVLLVAFEVRQIDSVVAQDAHGNPLPPIYRIDVHADPKDDNEAHAEIRADPSIQKKSVFKKLRMALAHLARKRKWLILPGDYRHLST